jgi:hypothetical protein
MTTADKVIEPVADGEGGSEEGGGAVAATAEAESEVNSFSPTHYDPHGGKLLEMFATFRGLLLKDVMNSLVKFGGPALATMAGHHVGSRVLEAFSKADVGLKRKAQLLKALRGHYAAMGRSRAHSSIRRRRMVHSISFLSGLLRVGRVRSWIRHRRMVHSNALFF